ncbi:glutamate--tRNA ligase [Opitutales bacterium]|nr:glutamate--tRNA ligase [Opitutales bacterium]MDA8991508.1 glutamate--tRNA ligase [Opitutales bacterium]
MTVRTRIAPSPTGAPHVGTAYMALFNLAFARKHGGQMVLRIEDTDQSRSTSESEEAILSSLKWLGLSWDEGPDCGGKFGPYRQSERLELYKDAIQVLVDNGYAYPCFCSAERLNEVRKKQIENKQTPRYDGHCLNLNKEEIEQKMQEGLPFVYRLKVPTDGTCVFKDELRGEVSIDWNQVDHQIIQKSDGFPTYHLANIVDDHHMGITHVIRGEEWINSTPKHMLLYEGMGWDAPIFAHLPLLRNPDKSKLSKRKNPTSIDYYKDAGYLPEAVVNYLGMMGYTLPDQKEIFNLEELSESFEIKRMSLGGPIFDLAKLKWLNGRYLREQLKPEDVLHRLMEWKANPEFLGKILPLALKRLETLSDFFPLAQFLLTDTPDYSTEELVGKLEAANVAKILKIAEWEMEKLPQWNRDQLSNLFQQIAEVEDLKLKQVLPPFFVAISGNSVSLPLFDSLALLGPDLTRTRLRSALEKLSSAGSGLSKKGLKKLEKEYVQKYGNRID